MQAQLGQGLGGDAVGYVQQAQEDMLRADVVVVQLASFSDGMLDDALGFGGGWQLVECVHRFAHLHKLSHSFTHLLGRDIMLLQLLGAGAFDHSRKPEQNMLRAEIVVVHRLGLSAGDVHYFPS